MSAGTRKRSAEGLNDSEDSVSPKRQKLEPKSFVELLKSTSAQDLLSKKTKTQLVSVTNKSTISDVLHALATNKILSAPVLDAEDGSFVGIVDVLDLVGEAIQLLHRSTKTLGELYSLPFFEQPVSLIMNLSCADEPALVRSSDSLQHVAKMLARRDSPIKLHRVVVCSDTDKPTIQGIISQSDIVRFAHDHLDSLSRTLAEAPLKTITGLMHAVVAVRRDAKIVDALDILYQNRVSGVAVTENGLLVDNLSASDLRGITPQTLTAFGATVSEFLSHARIESGAATPSDGAQKRRQTVSCTDTTTFAELIRLVVKESVHRAYIVDAIGHPIGVITLSDIIGKLIE